MIPRDRDENPRSGVTLLRPAKTRSQRLKVYKVTAVVSETEVQVRAVNADGTEAGDVINLTVLP